MRNKYLKSLKYHFDYNLWKVRNIYQESYVYYLFFLFSGIVYAKLHQGRSQNLKNRDITKIEKVALVFSKKHFDPENDIGKQHLMSNIPRHVYHLLKGKEVVYFDFNEKLKEIPQVDMVLGLVSETFTQIAKENPQASRILFLVNCHPLYRLKVLIKESLRLGKLFPTSEFVSPFSFLKALPYVDHFILIGNEFVKKTYSQYAIADSRLSVIDAGVERSFLVPNDLKRPQDRIRVVFVASHLAIRKGLFRVMEIWSELNNELNSDKKLKEKNINAELIIVGKMDKFKKEMDIFLEKNSNAVYKGYIESTDVAYRDILQSAHIVINVPVEEGQVGCLVEAMACGAMPYITEAAGVTLPLGLGCTISGNGIDFFHRGTQEKNLGRHFFSNAISKISVSEAYGEKLKEYIDKNHSWEKFERKLEAILCGEKNIR